MILVKTKTYKELCELCGHVVNFKSSCEFFPNFDVIGRVTNVYINNNNEVTFDIIVRPTNKKVPIGGNMKELRYDVLDK